MVALPFRSPLIAPVVELTETTLELEDLKRKPPSAPLSCVATTGCSIRSPTQRASASAESVSAVGAGTMVTRCSARTPL